MRKTILLLRKLDLYPTLCGERSLRKNIEDKRCSVDNTHIEYSFNALGLICGKLVVEDNDVDIKTLYFLCKLFKPARTYAGRSVIARTLLRNGRNNLNSCSVGKLFKLFHRKLGIKFARIGTDKHGSRLFFDIFRNFHSCSFLYEQQIVVCRCLSIKKASPKRKQLHYT